MSLQMPELDLFVHHSSAPTMECARAILGLKQRRQLGLECLVLQIVELHVHPGIGAFVFFGSLLPDSEDLRIRLQVKDSDDGFGLGRRTEHAQKDANRDDKTFMMLILFIDGERWCRGIFEFRGSKIQSTFYDRLMGLS